MKKSLTVASKLLQTKMSFFYPEREIPLKPKSPTHPWELIIKNTYTRTYKYGHNSAKNPVYPPPKKGKVPSANRVKFTVIGCRTSKEFIYCMNLVNGLHKYRWRHFDAPIITALTSTEWPKIWNDLKIRYGGEAYCLQTPVAVIINDKFLGGEKELKELIESKYIYHIKPDYYVEGVKLFTSYIKSSGRPCAYFEIMIDNKDIGSMIFMLYSDIVPRTCDNFLRLCKEKKGGYSGTPIHRIVKDSWIQGGGFGLKQSDLCCENFIVPHDRRGIIGMANDGRHIDCSTQFFISLQPQDWMTFKYVAFGQLISGEETLKKIEQVPAWYESPKNSIIIAKAGILNLECENIVINKGSYKCIDGHIENLRTIGEMFYEELLAKVFLEEQFRSLQRIEDEMIVHGETEITPEEMAKNLRTTQRFIRKKEEIDKQLEKSQGDRSVEKSENNDFDVDEYEYMPEEYSYQHVSLRASENGSDIKPELPYYLPITDVPYPGEVSSEFDLKRLLQGDYCLEIDLNKQAGKVKKKTDEDRLSFHSEILEEIMDKLNSPEPSSSQLSLGSDDEREIKKYLLDNADRVSFAGGIVKNMARSGTHNIFATQADLVTDEALRKYRVAEEEYRRGREKKVSITLPDDSDIHKEIIRRQTGFVRPEDLARLRRFERSKEGNMSEDDDDDNELDDYLPYTRQVSIQQPQSTTSYKKKMASSRKTGNVPLDDKEKNDGIAKPNGNIHAQEVDDEIQDVDEEVQEADEQTEKRENSLPSVHEKEVVTTVSEQHNELEGIEKQKGTETQKETEKREGGEKRGSSRGVVAWRSTSSDFPAMRTSDVNEERRISVLTRLIDDVAVDDSPGPTLKGYRPVSEQQQKKPLFLITYSPEKHIELKNMSDDSREMYLRRRHSIPMNMSKLQQNKPMDILLLQHGKNVYRKISTDYVKTIDQIEQKEETSLRSLEYAKRRPAISVEDYQKKNKAYNDNLEKKSKTSNINKQ